MVPRYPQKKNPASEAGFVLPMLSRLPAGTRNVLRVERGAASDGRAQRARPRLATVRALQPDRLAGDAGVDAAGPHLRFEDDRLHAGSGGGAAAIHDGAGVL